MRVFCALVDRDRFRARGGQFERRGAASDYRIWGSGVRISSGAPFRFQKNLRKRAAVHPVTQGLPVHPANPGRARTVRVLENERQRQHPTRRRSVPFNRGRVVDPASCRAESGEVDRGDEVHNGRRLQAPKKVRPPRNVVV